MREELSLSFPDVIGELTPDVIGELIPGVRGSFEVIVDDVLLFSKLALDRFPDEGEIVSLIKQM